MALVALSKANSEGIYDIAKPFGLKFSIFFLISVHLSLVPLIGTPRTASVAYS